MVGHQPNSALHLIVEFCAVRCKVSPKALIILCVCTYTCVKNEIGIQPQELLKITGSIMMSMTSSLSHGLGWKGPSHFHPHEHNSMTFKWESISFSQNKQLQNSANCFFLQFVQICLYAWHMSLELHCYSQVGT